MSPHSKFATLVFFLSFCMICCAHFQPHHIVEHVNHLDVPWTADIHDFDWTSLDKFVGTRGHLQQLDRKSAFSELCKKEEYKNGDEGRNNEYEDFDARNHWFECESISHIWNQGNCAADWAIAVTSAINDRICIASKTKIKALYSPQKLLSCCHNCGDGCKGGYSYSAWQYWTKRGIVTGGEFGSSEGCQPWKIEPCDHNQTNQTSICGKFLSETPQCDLHCSNKNYTIPFNQDIVKGKRVRKSCSCQVRREIRRRGPVTATMRVYEDFLTYKKGIYQHVTGKYVGLLTVKIIGWGIYRGVPYWLAANSWGTSWGENGFFKIIRNENECLIEDYLTFGKVIL
ncbi:cathepsin B-like cysteine proteinase 4 [Adelges cooleyi]|uniref:cathepsin B-like cysteine proteinase 4 n=1 Tax=Adelges cooleyi TaxID=133065 RepID=UPI00217F239C|nr:cathepsin B-like cysteine proteinase 4 [Adelges cooleyi]